MVKSKETVNPRKILSLIYGGLKEKILKKDKDEATKNYDLLIKDAQKLSENYSKELLIQIVESYPFCTRALKKLTSIEQEEYFNYIDEYILEEKFFGEYLSAFNEKFEAVALHSSNRSVLYINGLYCRHFSEADTKQNMVSVFMQSSMLQKRTTISDNKDVEDFLGNKNNKAPKWLKDFPGIQHLVTIPKVPKKTIKIMI